MVVTTPTLLTSGSVLAVTRQPFFLMGAALYFTQFGVITDHPSLDDELYKERCALGVLYLNDSGTIKKLEVESIVAHPQTIEFINSCPQPIHILVSKSTSLIEQTCAEQGWQLIGMPSTTKDIYEDKTYFRNLLTELALPTLPSLQFSVTQLLASTYQQVASQLGNSFVLQLIAPSGFEQLKTTFVFNEPELATVKERLSSHHLFDHSMLATRYINGPSLSMLGCATRYGVLTGYPQTQIIDNPHVMNVELGKGVFCGHDWSFTAQYRNAFDQMRSHTQKIGEVMSKNNYKGLFGIDFIYDQEKQIAYPLECNPRHTGALPTYTFLEQAQWHRPPLEMFHLLENTGVEYSKEWFDQAHQSHPSPLQGAHLNLNNKFPVAKEIGTELQPGLYSYNEQGSFSFITATADFTQLKPQTFLLLNGVPKKGAVIEPNAQLAKIIFYDSILLDFTTLKPSIIKTVEELYNHWFSI